MKKHPIIVLIWLAACFPKEDPKPNTTGYLDIGLNVVMTISEEMARTGSVNTDDFLVTVFTANQVEVISYRAAEIPPLTELPVGEYFVSAHSNNLKPAAFDAPFYAGKSMNFQINMEETKQIQVNCTLGNCMLSIDYSKSIKDNFSAYSSVVSFTGGSLAYSGAETRIGYFDLAPLTITASLEYQNGDNAVTKSVTGQIPQPEAKTHYKIRIDATLNNGQISFGLSVDENVNIVELNFGEGPAEPPVTMIGINEAVYGDLIITEIMFDPDALPDTQGEWIEIYNPTNKKINLNGLKILDNTSTILINQDLVVEPSGYFTVAKSANAIENPGFVSSVLSLANLGELLKLVTPDGLEISSVDYTLILQAMSTPAGYALNLSRSKFTADQANLPQNWCLATTPYSTGDKGTPGTANIICQ